ncbi:MAG: hypothetical protein NT105_00765 [Verrucomicrobia bacterium]|nr:hypothetical protein [Verrucomicrobiota bacterium]
MKLRNNSCGKPTRDSRFCAMADVPGRFGISRTAAFRLVAERKVNSMLAFSPGRNRVERLVEVASVRALIRQLVAHDNEEACK